MTLTRNRTGTPAAATCKSPDKSVTATFGVAACSDGSDNDGDGAIFIRQPHNTDAFAGVAPQGYLAVVGNHLFVPGGRSIPACLDRATGKFIAAKQTVYNNVYENFDEKTGKVTYRKDIRDQKVDQWLASCPGPEGGHDWQAMSYHQPSDAVIIPLSQSCVFMLGNGSQTYFEMPGTDGNMGRLSAYRAADLKPLWSFQQRAPFLTGVISTAGNVAFVGDFDRVFRAVDKIGRAHV